MGYLLLTCITRATPLSWAGAMAGIWLLPAAAVVVLTGLATTGSVAGAIRATRDHDIAALGHALADATRGDGSLRHHLRRAQ